MFIKPTGYNILFNGQHIDWAETKREAKELVEMYSRKFKLSVGSFTINSLEG